MKIILLMTLSGIYLFLAFSIESPFPRAVFLGVAIWLFVWGYKELKESADKEEEQLKIDIDKVISEIPHTECVVSDDYLTGLLIDEKNENIHIINRNRFNEDFKRETYHFNDIFEAALIENDKIQYFIAKGGKLQNSLLNQNINFKQGDDEEEEVQKISVKFLINNISKPEIEYTFFESDRAILKDSDEYKEIIEICKEWFQKISIIIKRSESIPVRHWE